MTGLPKYRKNDHVEVRKDSTNGAIESISRDQHGNFWYTVNGIGYAEFEIKKCLNGVKHKGLNEQRV